MIEIIPVGSSTDYHFYLERLSFANNVTEIVFITSYEEENVTIANNFIQAVRFYEKEKYKISHEKVELKPTKILSLMQYLFKKKQPVAINLGGNLEINLNLFLGLYNSLLEAPDYSFAYSIYQSKNEFGETTYRLHLILPPLKIGKRSMDIVKFLDENLNKEYSIEDITKKCNIPLEYGKKVIHMLEKRGYLLVKSYKHNRKMYYLS